MTIDDVVTEIKFMISKHYFVFYVRTERIFVKENNNKLKRFALQIKGS